MSAMKDGELFDFWWSLNQDLCERHNASRIGQETPYRYVNGVRYSSCNPTGRTTCFWPDAIFLGTFTLDRTSFTQSPINEP
jgi:hypothetical protein